MTDGGGPPEVVLPTVPLAGDPWKQEGPRRTAEEVARRLRPAYGLKNTLADPLIVEGRVIGALVLSQRMREDWPESTRELLDWASREVSAALGRAYAHEAAETRAHIDALTGLPNRRYFDELAVLLKRRRRAGDVLGVLMIDIDRFKRLNDRYGHGTGDRVLRLVADAIASTVRADDTPVRYGGEEFAVLLKQSSDEQARDVAERVRGAVAAIPMEALGIERPVSVSVGVAVASGPGGDLALLVEEADRALYLAKRAGRDRVVIA
ncbi:MAG: diguanylate cyclase [Chloroflexi bacterium]|nr:diguanylate cyclase [Chloroflexota bacterium]